MFSISLLKQIKQTCGVKYSDLGYISEKEFDIAIEIYITAIKTWINMYTNKIYTNPHKEYPPALGEIVREIVNKIIANDSFQKDLVIFNNENYEAFKIIETIITPDIKDRLNPYIQKSKVRFINTGRPLKRKKMGDLFYGRWN